MAQVYPAVHCTRAKSSPVMCDGYENTTVPLIVCALHHAVTGSICL